MSDHLNQVFPPGKTVAESIEFLGMTKTEFARRIGLSESQLQELICGKLLISAELAFRLESVTGSPANFWKHLESKYRRSLL